jgi:uncharacterized RDD family membrane protein YckC
MGKQAGLSRRSIAFLIDYAILEVLRWVTLDPLFSGKEISPDQIMKAASSGRLEELSEMLIWLLVILNLVFLLWGLYFVLFTWQLGQTPGKKLLGISVVREDGQPMDLKVSVVRFIGLNISLMAFGLGFFWAAFDKKGQTWHDKMAKTQAVLQTS